jgi:hypothetical protein
MHDESAVIDITKDPYFAYYNRLIAGAKNGRTIVRRLTLADAVDDFLPALILFCLFMSVTMFLSFFFV